MNKPPSHKAPINTSTNNDIGETIKIHIEQLKSLSEYSVKDLVQHAEKFGPYLRQRRLETNQIRKFLDAINQLKASLVASNLEKIQAFEEIQAEVILLKPKLAYAATRQNAVEPLQRVISAAIDKTDGPEDFKRLVQLLESIIAYHKAEGGK